MLRTEALLAVMPIDQAKVCGGLPITLEPAGALLVRGLVPHWLDVLEVYRGLNILAALLVDDGHNRGSQVAH